MLPGLRFIHMTLSDILDARDRRRRHELELMERHPELTLVVLTVVSPGQEKLTTQSRAVFDAGVRELLNGLDCAWHELFPELETGPEGYFLTPSTATEAKARAWAMEDSHPLGRLMDIDVLGRQGDQAVPLSRTDLGLKPRGCLICGAPARECMRAGRHSYGQLLEKIRLMVEDYQTETGNKE